jgi:hypothetical protein
VGAANSGVPMRARRSSVQLGDEEMKMKILNEQAAKLAKHAQDLATAFNVTLVLRDDYPPEVAAAGTCGDGQRMVHAKTITDETSYAVVLHELGHCVSAFGSLRQNLLEKPPAVGCHPRDRHRWMNLMLEEERAAWEWARHYALFWSAAMQQVESYAYDTYLEGKRRTR